MDPTRDDLNRRRGGSDPAPGDGPARRTASDRRAINRRRVRLGFLMLLPATLAAAAVVAASSSSPHAVPASSTLRALADGSAKAGRAAPDWSRAPVLRVGGRPRRSAYLRFRVPRGIRRATLWLYVTGGPRRVRVAALRVRGSVRPALASAGKRHVTGVVGRTTAGRIGRWISIDVSRAARTSGTVTLVLVSRSRRARLFSSREGGRPPRLVVQSGSGRPAAGGGATPPGAPATPSLPSGRLPAVVYAPAPPTRFVSPTGDDTGNCTRADPCLTLDRAYAVAALGETVEMAGGTYDTVAVRPDPRKGGSTCVSDPASGSCVVVMAAPGTTVSIRDLTVGVRSANSSALGLVLLSRATQRITSADTSLWSAGETALVGMSHRNYFMSGGSWVTINGGEVGPETTPDGTHPEVQRVYNTNPLVVPRHVRFEGIYFHDVNTTNSKAHVDCLQVENGTDLQIVGNRFERCGSVGLRMSYGSDSDQGPPTNVLIENNAFGDCADIPVSQCYYAAQLGVGHDVTVRNNSSTMSIQGPNSLGSGYDAFNVRYVGNAINGSFQPCGPGTFRHNVVTGSPCGGADRRVGAIGFVGAGRLDLRLSASSPAIDAGDPGDFPATDAAGAARPRGGGPDAGAYESH